MVMKKYLLLSLCLRFVMPGQSQQPIAPMQLHVSDKKTTHLVFPYAITAGDCGSRDIHAQQLKDAGHILRVRADKENFVSTNLTVVTADGKVYPFDVVYSEHPVVTTFHFEKDQDAAHDENYTGAKLPYMERVADKILFADRNDRIRSISTGALVFRLNKIYADRSVAYYFLTFSNFSTIAYHIDQLHCHVAEKKTMKRTAAQAIDLQPLLVYGNESTVYGGSSTRFVVALPLQTLRRQQRLTVRITERDGARHLALRITPSMILLASPL